MLRKDKYLSFLPRQKRQSLQICELKITNSKAASWCSLYNASVIYDFWSSLNSEALRQEKTEVSILLMHEGGQVVSCWMVRRSGTQLRVSFSRQKRRLSAHLQSALLAVRPPLVLGHSALATSSPSMHIHMREGIDKFDADGFRCLCPQLQTQPPRPALYISPLSKSVLQYL